jgi:hypothetical protein
MTPEEFTGLKKHIQSVKKAAKEGEDEANLLDILTEEEVVSLVDFADSQVSRAESAEIRCGYKDEKISNLNREFSDLRLNYERTHPIWTVLVAFVQLPIVMSLVATLQLYFAHLRPPYMGYVSIGLSALFGLILFVTAMNRREEDWNRRI